MPIAAAIQMNSIADIEKNLQQAETLIKQAVKQNAELVVLPEMFATLGYIENEVLQLAENFGNGKIQDFLSTTAKKYNTWIVGGSLPIQSKNKNRAHNSCLVFNNNGECVARYDKIHLFDVCVSQNTEEYKESNTIEAGIQIITIDTPIGKLGLTICYDIRFPELFRNLLNRGAEIITIPAAFTVTTGQAHWELLTRARAIENTCYLIGAGEVGQHNATRATYGHSLIVDPWGTVLASLTNQPGIITAEIDLNKQKEIRAKMPIQEHQKIFATRENPL